MRVKIPVIATACLGKSLISVQIKGQFLFLGESKRIKSIVIHSWDGESELGKA